VCTKHKFVNIDPLKTRETGEEGHVVGGRERRYFVGERGRSRIALLTISHASSACTSDKTAGKLKAIKRLKSVTWNKNQKNFDLVGSAEAHNLEKKIINIKM